MYCLTNLISVLAISPLSPDTKKLRINFFLKIQIITFWTQKILRILLFSFQKLHNFFVLHYFMFFFIAKRFIWYHMFLNNISLYILFITQQCSWLIQNSKSDIAISNIAIFNITLRIRIRIRIIYFTDRSTYIHNLWFDLFFIIVAWSVGWLDSQVCFHPVT